MTNKLTLKTVVLLGVICNILLAFLKFVSGFLFNSLALIADGVESFVDIFGSIIIWSGLKYGEQEADEKHPFGHGKAESLSAFTVAFIIILVGIGLLSSSVMNLGHEDQAPSIYAIAVLVFVIISKEALYRITNHYSNISNSSAGKVEAWHHRLDAITSLFTLAGVSIAALLGDEYVKADTIAAIFASCVIIFNGFSLIRDPVGELLDQNEFSLANEVKALSLTLNEVDDVEKCEVRKCGRSYRVVMHIEVDPDLSVKAAHDITGILKKLIKDKYQNISNVLIHVEPSGNRE